APTERERWPRRANPGRQKPRKDRHLQAPGGCARRDHDQRPRRRRHKRQGEPRRRGPGGLPLRGARLRVVVGGAGARVGARHVRGEPDRFRFGERRGVHRGPLLGRLGGARGDGAPHTVRDAGGPDGGPRFSKAVQAGGAAGALLPRDPGRRSEGRGRGRAGAVRRGAGARDRGVSGVFRAGRGRGGPAASSRGADSRAGPRDERAAAGSAVGEKREGWERGL
ncbi:MAG: Uncharacterized protein conserved in bacteria, partial [uncultured Rubrobacteraceae bacterium]